MINSPPVGSNPTVPARDLIILIGGVIVKYYIMNSASFKKEYTRIKKLGSLYWFKM